MSADLDFAVLGAVDATVSGRPVALGGQKPRKLLAALIAAHGRVVDGERLIDAIWDEEPPRSARGIVQTYVAGLRRAFEAVDAADVVRRHPSGYLISAGAVDYRRFATLVDRAQQRVDDGQLAEAVEDLREALALWRGPAFGGLAGPVLGPVAARWEEERLSALEQRISTELTLGRHVGLVGELAGLVQLHPLREGLRAQLIYALHRSGRQADALTVYREGRDLLVAELGVEPGNALRTAHESVLRDEPWTPPVPAAVAPTIAVRPAQLPAAIHDFVGRESQVDALLAALAYDDARIAPPIGLITGRGGSGKSTMAVQVAQRLAAEFPDGQLYATLAGMGSCPVAPEQILTRFLSALGVTAPPKTLDELTSLYRSHTAGRRLLIVLDDARDVTQLRPLLPGSASCAVLITSRQVLGGLATRQIDLDCLSATEGTSLLAAIIGADRLHREPDAAAKIVSACDGMPLALRIAGARLASRPHWPVARLADRIANSRMVLDELQLGDEQVRASVALSYQGLETLAARAFRLLGALGAADFPHWIVRPLLGGDEVAAEEALEQLIESRLVDVVVGENAATPRCRIHGLLLIYASEQSAAQDSPAEVDAAMEQVGAAWLWLLERFSAAHPRALVAPGRRVTTARPLDSIIAERALADPKVWWETERGCLVTVAERVAERGLHVLATELADEMAVSVLATGNQFDAWDRTHQAALTSAHRAGDRDCEAMMLAGLSRLRCEQDRFGDAAEYAERALAMFRAADHDHGTTATLAHLGYICRERGRLPEAINHLTAALAMARASGNPHTTGHILRLLGATRLDADDLGNAETALTESLAVYRSVGNAHGAAIATRTLGLLYRAAGDLSRSAELLTEARDAFVLLGDDLMAAYAVRALAKTFIRQGRIAEAEQMLPAALADCRRLGDRWGEAMALRVIGELRLTQRHWSAALDALHASITRWSEIGAELGKARALGTLALVYAGRGDDEHAVATQAAADQLFHQCQHLDQH